MFIFGQIPGRSMPSSSWPMGAKVGGISVELELQGGGGYDVQVYEPGRQLMQPLEIESDGFISVLALLLPEICP
jgi:hypothetical protein